MLLNTVFNKIQKSVFLIKLAHPWCADSLCACSCRVLLGYPRCARAGSAQTVKDEATSPPARVVFQTCDFLINLLLSEVAFFIFISSLPRTCTRARQLWPWLRVPSAVPRGRRGVPSPAVPHHAYSLCPLFSDHTSPSEEAAG